MNYKPFSKEDYIKADIKAKQEAVSFLISSNEFKMIKPLLEQDEHYKEYDFEIFSHLLNRTIFVETEVKHVWTNTERWQGYNTIDIPYHKKDSKADLFIMFNKHFNVLQSLKMETILKSAVKTKNCKCSSVNTKMEKFFAVSVKEACFFKNTAFGWIAVE